MHNAEVAGGDYSNLKVCPEGFDSIKGNVGGSNVYMIYENVKAYPSYLVEFTYKKWSATILILLAHY